MNIGIELVKRIISSDELCDKVNSAEYRDSYVKNIEKYILSLIDDFNNLSYNMQYINRFLNKFVIPNNSKEDIFFNPVLLRLYNVNIENDDFASILNYFNFSQVKELLMNRYDQIISGNGGVSDSELLRMISFYNYVCPNYILPIRYIDFFTYHFVSKKIKLGYELISYFYKSFCMSFSDSKHISCGFDIVSNATANDPYYDFRKNSVIIYKQNIGSSIDYMVLSDIFYQIKYIYLLKSISSSNNFYSFDQLRFVKEICLGTILDYDYFNSNYGDISFLNELRIQSKEVVKSYYKKLGLDIDISDDVYFSIDLNEDDNSDKAISIDVLFDLVLKRENPNLLRGLIKNYPVLGCEYRLDKKKSLLNLLLDIYKNRKLLNILKKDLNWYNGKVGADEDLIIIPKIERLNNKISVCSSCINVMSSIISDEDMTSYDIIRSISDLITYNTDDSMVQNDIYIIMSSYIPKKISRLCDGRSIEYREGLKQRIIKCYLDSMGLVRNSIDSVYFMKLYSCLEACTNSIDVR